MPTQVAKRARGSSLPHILLHAPVQHVGYKNLIARADRDVMRLAVFACCLARPGAGHHAQHVAVEIELHDLAGVAVRQPDVVRAHEQPARRARMLGLADIVEVSVEHLNAGIVAVGDVEQALVVEHQRVRQIEFAGPCALAAQSLDEVAVGIELHHARFRLAVPFQHVEVAGGPDHRLVRLLEQPQVPARVPLAGAALDAQHHLHPPRWIELVDQVHGDVGRPDVVVLVDPQTMRPVEQPVAEAADEISVGVEFHQRHRPAMENEDVALGVERDARGAAEVRAGRKLEGFGNRDVGKRWKFHSRGLKAFSYLEPSFIAEFAGWYKAEVGAARSSCPAIAVRRTASLPLAYARASTSFFDPSKTWMAGTSPAMTETVSIVGWERP